MLAAQQPELDSRFVQQLRDAGLGELPVTMHVVQVRACFWVFVWG